jgi:hypothetical protein
MEDQSNNNEELQKRGRNNTNIVTTSSEMERNKRNNKNIVLAIQNKCAWKSHP